MSKPWHGKIAALSRLYLIRDNMGERQGSGSSSRVEGEAMSGWRGRRKKQNWRRDTRQEAGVKGGGRWRCNLMEKHKPEDIEHLEQMEENEKIERDSRKI